MRDILRVCVTSFFLLVALDPDGSVWKNRQSHERLYAKLLVACLNGHGFTLSRTVVLCYPTELAPIVLSVSSSKSAQLP